MTTTYKYTRLSDLVDNAPNLWTVSTSDIERILSKAYPPAKGSHDLFDRGPHKNDPVFNIWAKEYDGNDVITHEYRVHLPSLDFAKQIANELDGWVVDDDGWVIK
jgi:hypothetical protein